jgi:alkylated DNA repair dioxygenase AlkB
MPRTSNSTSQKDLFGSATALDSGMPQGFRYSPDFLSEAEEQLLATWIGTLPLKPFEFRGYLGLRRTASFGLRYDYARRAVRGAKPLPEQLLSLRDKVAGFASHNPEDFRQMLVSEYAPGAPIGWHKDKPQFEDVVGVSLLAPANFRLRQKADAGWTRRSLILAPRSIYLLSGEVRHEWEHSIPEMESLRYSITFRTLAAGHARLQP